MMLDLDLLIIDLVWNRCLDDDLNFLLCLVLLNLWRSVVACDFFDFANILLMNVLLSLSIWWWTSVEFWTVSRILESHLGSTRLSTSAVLLNVFVSWSGLPSSGRTWVVETWLVSMFVFLLDKIETRLAVVVLTNELVLATSLVVVMALLLSMYSMLLELLMIDSSICMSHSTILSLLSSK